MTALTRPALFLFPLLTLTGCYDSNADLIGGNATDVTAFDSLLTKDGSVFYWLRDKDNSQKSEGFSGKSPRPLANPDRDRRVTLAGSAGRQEA
jgi:hypothetical protein